MLVDMEKLSIRVQMQGFLVVQWLRIQFCNARDTCLILVQEDPTQLEQLNLCSATTEPVP